LLPPGDAFAENYLPPEKKEVGRESEENHWETDWETDWETGIPKENDARVVVTVVGRGSSSAGEKTARETESEKTVGGRLLPREIIPRGETIVRDMEETRIAGQTCVAFYKTRKNISRTRQTRPSRCGYMSI
jgi:hypothetical protein